MRSQPSAAMSVRRRDHPGHKAFFERDAPPDSRAEPAGDDPVGHIWTNVIGAARL